MAKDALALKAGVGNAHHILKSVNIRGLLPGGGGTPDHAGSLRHRKTKTLLESHSAQKTPGGKKKPPLARLKEQKKP